VPVGKQSFDAQKLVDNIEQFVAHVRRLRPPTTKGTYIKKVCLATTMSPSVRIDIS
jgi:large subunit ribosomal protein L1